MRLSMLCAAALLAGSASLAVAQQEPPAPPPGQGEVAPPPPPPDAMTPLPEGHPPIAPGMAHRGMGHSGMGHRGPRPPMKGFDLRMGKDNGLRVNCGDEPIKVCIDAAQPLVDRLSGGAAPPPPPPPANP